MNNFDIYDDAFYNMHLQWKPCYVLIADWIIDNCNFKTSMEFGCGNGFLSEHLNYRGKSIRCSDFSESSIKFISNSIKEKFVKYDITKIIDDVKQSELVMCFEVAEHIDPKGTDNFFENLTKAASKYIVFSSEPTTNGHGHINCHPREFWIEEICKRGFTFREDLSNKFKAELGESTQAVSWYANNFLYFERK